MKAYFQESENPDTLVALHQQVPFPVVLVLRNDGARAIGIYQWDRGLDYDLEVTEAGGKPRPPTRYGKKRLGMRLLGPRTARILAPGEQVMTKILVNRVVDVSEPASYRVTVRRLADGSNPEIESNVLHMDLD